MRLPCVQPNSSATDLLRLACRSILAGLRWLAFIILAYVMLGLAVGLGGVARVGATPINLVLIAAVFICINAQRDPAMIACFVLGLLHDLVGGGPVGMYALAYCCVALLVAGTERSMAVEHPFTHFFVTLFGGIIVAIVVKFIDAWHGIGTSLWTDLLTAFYTAIVAVPVLWALNKFRKRFRFRTSVGW